MEATSKQAPLFTVCYAQKDEALKEEFVEYLAMLLEIGSIAGWNERQVQSGTVWTHVVDSRLLLVDYFTLLISPRLLSSGYCSGAEMREALARSLSGQLVILPILLYHVAITGFPFECFQTVTHNNKPVSSWSDRSEAWWGIDQKIRELLRRNP